MSESSYEKCHVPHRGYLSNEIGAAREVLQKHKKLCPDSVKELRDKTDLSMSECCDMLRCLLRDTELELLQEENVRLIHIIGECTSQLRGKHKLGYIVMPMGGVQALCETVAEIVGKQYDMTNEGVKFIG